ncbi:hypothetical protein BH10CYA1_BH10CYA1_45930 [soil metagenome]
MFAATTFGAPGDFSCRIFLGIVLSNSQSSSGSVLLIHNSNDDSSFSKQSLQISDKADLDVFETNSLSDGVKKLAHSSFDIVLLDLNLSDSKGLATLIKLRNASSSIPIIILVHEDEADETIRRLNLLEQREHFIGMLVHDLRNPIFKELLDRMMVSPVTAPVL